MKNYKSGSHSRHDLKAHVVWITKYRKEVLQGEIARRVREIVRQEWKGDGGGDPQGARVEGSCSPACGLCAEPECEQNGAAVEGEKLMEAPAGVSRDQKEVLGTADVGEGILRGQQWERDR